MQTFLPFEDYHVSAEVLDQARLGKQRVECLQILKALIIPGYGWQKHPAVLMWKGAERELASYGLAVCAEWESRGLVDNTAILIRGVYHGNASSIGDGEPHWRGCPGFHESHRGNLLRKDFDHYRAYFPDADSDAEYVWPIRSNGQGAMQGR